MVLVSEESGFPCFILEYNGIKTPGTGPCEAEKHTKQQKHEGMLVFIVESSLSDKKSNISKCACDHNGSRPCQQAQKQ